MNDLRTVAQQALEALEHDNPAGRTATITALRAALAEPQEPVQEPVAWRFKPMIGSPWSLSDDGYYISCKRDQRYIVEPLCTAPPQRKPLSDADLAKIWDDALDQLDPRDQLRFIARAIEAAHGIK